MLAHCCSCRGPNPQRVTTRRGGDEPVSVMEVSAASSMRWRRVRRLRSRCRRSDCDCKLFGAGSAFQCRNARQKDSTSPSRERRKAIATFDLGHVRPTDSEAFGTDGAWWRRGTPRKRMRCRAGPLVIRRLKRRREPRCSSVCQRCATASWKGAQFRRNVPHQPVGLMRHSQA